MKTSLEQAIAFIRAGNENRGRELLIEILKANPADDTAWVWMAAVSADNQLRKDCLDEALKHNPNNKMAKDALSRLNASKRIPSRAIATRSPQPTRSQWIALLHVASVCCVFFGLLFGFVNWGHHQDDLSFQSEGQLVPAHIVDVYYVSGRGSGNYVEYTYTVNARLYTDESRVSSYNDWAKMRVGDALMIRYLRSRPEISRYYNYENGVDPEKEYRDGWILAGVFFAIPILLEGALAVARS